MKCFAECTFIVCVWMLSKLEARCVSSASFNFGTHGASSVCRASPADGQEDEEGQAEDKRGQAACPAFRADGPEDEEGGAEVGEASGHSGRNGEAAGEVSEGGAEKG